MSIFAKEARSVSPVRHARDRSTQPQPSAPSQLGPPRWLPRLTIVTAVLALFFAWASFRGQEGTVWHVGFVLSTAIFLCMFLAMLVNQARGSLLETSRRHTASARQHRSQRD